MRKNKLTVALAALLMLPSLSFAQAPVFLTAGQSNADGRAYVSEMPAYLHEGYKHLHFANITFKSNGKFGQRKFDPKGKFAFCDVTNYYLDKTLGTDFYSIKCTYGGTAIDTASAPAKRPVWCADKKWIAANKAHRGDVTTGKSLTKSLTEGFADCVDSTLARLSKGYDVKAIMWHQGESDRKKASHYYKNFKDMINYMRQAIYKKTGRRKDKKLPFIFGSVPHASKQYSREVEEAQIRVAKELPNVYRIDLSDAGLREDVLHFDAAWTEYVGKMMFNKLVELKLIDAEPLYVVKPKKEK